MPMPNTAQGTASRGEGDLALVIELKRALIKMAEYPHGAKSYMYARCAETYLIQFAKREVVCVLLLPSRSHKQGRFANSQHSIRNCT